MIVTYRPGPGDVFQAFARGFADITAVYRYDFLLDLRGLVGPLDILSSTESGKRWTELTKGRDVGRRTAIVSNDDAIQQQLEMFRSIYPFRKIAMFSDFDSAMTWVREVGDFSEDEVQFI